MYRQTQLDVERIIDYYMDPPEPAKSEWRERLFEAETELDNIEVEYENIRAELETSHCPTDYKLQLYDWYEKHIEAPMCSKCGAEIKAAKNGDQTISAQDVSTSTGGLCLSCFKAAQ